MTDDKERYLVHDGRFVKKNVRMNEYELTDEIKGMTFDIRDTYLSKTWQEALFFENYPYSDGIISHLNELYGDKIKELSDKIEQFSGRKCTWCMLSSNCACCS